VPSDLPHTVLSLVAQSEPGPGVSMKAPRALNFTVILHADGKGSANVALETQMLDETWHTVEKYSLAGGVSVIAQTAKGPLGPVRLTLLATQHSLRPSVTGQIISL
jgi:hypothetical protein